MSKYQELKDAVDAMAVDAAKSAKGNASAGKRVRLALQKIKKIAQDFRLEILASRKKKVSE